jgi:hypothetical protein
MKNFRKLIAAVVTVGALGAAPAACIFVSPDPVVDVEAEPPAAQVEVVPAERPGFIWIHGYWQRFGSEWRWHAGYWEHARSGFVWQDGRWDRRGNHSVWVPGQWQQGGGTVVVPSNNGNTGTVVVHDHTHETEAPPPNGGVVVHDHTHP